MNDYEAAIRDGAEMRGKLRTDVRAHLVTMARIEDAAQGRSLSRSQQADYDEATRNYAGLATLYGLPTAVSADERRALINRLEQPDKLELQADQIDRYRAAMDAEGRSYKSYRSHEVGESRMVRDAFQKAGRGIPSSFDSSTSQGFLQRDLTSAAGTTAPQTFADFLVAYERTADPIFALATTIQAGVGATFTIPRLTSDASNGGTVTAEAAGITTGDSTFSAVTLSYYKYAHMSLWSSELAEDMSPSMNLDEMIAMSAGRQLVLDAGAHLTTGSGSSQPSGYVTGALNGGTASGTVALSTWNFIDPKALSDLTFAVAAPYRASGAFVVSTSAFKAILGWQDKNNRPLLSNAPFAGQPSRLFGYPVYESPNLAALGSASKSVVFGDFSRYYIARKATRVDVSREYKLGNDQIATRVVERLGGQLVDTAALAYLVSAAA